METQPSQTPNPNPAAVKQEEDPKKSIRFGATYVFRLRKHIAGPFVNLWEASLLDPRACDKAPIKKLISDADALIYCMENFQGTLEDDGL